MIDDDRLTKLLLINPLWFIGIAFVFFFLLAAGDGCHCGIAIESHESGQGTTVVE